MLSHSSEAVRVRETRCFSQFAGPHEERLILFGAGPLGRLVGEALQKKGLPPIAFADNNDRLWGTQVGGIPVLSPSFAIRSYGESACFVVTIFNGSGVRQQLTELGCKHVAPFVALFWKHADIFTPQLGIDLPHKLPAFADEIRTCLDILADEQSRRELLAQLQWRYELNYDVLPGHLPPSETYFPMDMITPCENEVFVDGGSFQGDTLPGFSAHWNGRFHHIFALEPDPQNLIALESKKEELGLTTRMTVLPYALGEKNGQVSFASTGTVSSQISEHGEQSSSVECRRLDEISWPVTPTYIKMDIEGAEPQAIVGAAGLLKRDHPILAACTYHRTEHLWQIPNLIHSIAPEYKLFLRRYAEECWEGVCYAIPDHRLRRA